MLQPMETDIFFYKLFKHLPETVFDLLAMPAERAKCYRFDSVELKKSMRIDGFDTGRKKSASCGRLESARRLAFSSLVSLAKPFSRCLLRCLIHVSLAPPFASRFLACLIHAREYSLASRFG
jgi:Protein of unknown function (DUF2887)